MGCPPAAARQERGVRKEAAVARVSPPEPPALIWAGLSFSFDLHDTHYNEANVSNDLDDCLQVIVIVIPIEVKTLGLIWTQILQHAFPLSQHM